MDVKGITWVGNIYQKFESLCLEVEEIMYQDTVDFMENQVQTVGASVKKFYSGVMTDLLPPSPKDLVKKETNETDLQEFKDSEIITKPRFHIKKETLKREIDQVRKRSKILGHVERKKVNVDNVFTVPATLSGFQQMDRFGRSEQSFTESMKEKQELSVPETQPSVKNTEIHQQVENVMEEYENRTDPSCDLAAATQDNGSDNGKVSVIEPSTLEDILHCNTDETNIFFEPGQVDSSSDVISTEEPSFTASNFERLDESCILVDGDELSFIALSKGKQKPYKKKLRNAFSPRKRSSRAREYKQLSLKYSDSNGNAQSGPERAKPENSSQSQQVSESEWELL